MQGRLTLRSLLASVSFVSKRDQNPAIATSVSVYKPSSTLGRYARSDEAGKDVSLGVAPLVLLPSRNYTSTKLAAPAR